MTGILLLVEIWIVGELPGSYTIQNSLISRWLQIKLEEVITVNTVIPPYKSNNQQIVTKR